METSLSSHEPTARRGIRDLLAVLRVLSKLKPTALTPKHVQREMTVHLDSALLFSKGFPNVKS